MKLEKPFTGARFKESKKEMQTDFPFHRKEFFLQTQ